MTQQNLYKAPEAAEKNSYLQGAVPRDFRLQVFFIETVSPKPLSISLGSFQIFSKSRGDIYS
jgi:hypothetical protein